MNHRTLLLHSLIVVCIASAFSQVQNRISMAGTRVSIIPPQNYMLPRSAAMLVRSTNDAVLLVREISSSFQESLNDFMDSENIDEKGLTRITAPQQISIDGWKGVRINYSQRQGLLSQLQIITQVFILGDSLESLIITASYPDTMQNRTRDELIASIQTIKWDRSRRLNLMELNHFLLVPSGGFQLYKSDGEAALITLHGERLDSTGEDPFMIIQLYNRPFSPLMPDEQTERMLESIIMNFFPFTKNLSAVEFLKDTIDGIRTFETVFMGQHFDNDSPISLYLSLFLHPVKNIALLGFSGPHHHDSLITIFKETMRSFKRSTIDLQEHADCYELMMNKKFKEAAVCYNGIIKTNSQSLSARLGRAEALRLSGKFENAMREYNSIVQADEAFEEVYMAMARTNSALKKYYEAEKEYDKVIALNIANAQAYLERSKAKEKYGNTDGAVRDLDKAALFDPNAIEIQMARAHAKTIMHEYDGALASYNKAVELEGKNGYAYLGRGELLAKMGHYQEALKDLNSARLYLPDTKKLSKLCGEVLMKTGEYEEAIKEFNLHLRYNKNDKETFILRGRTYGYSGKYQNAIDDFSHVLKKDKDDEDALFYKGVFQFFKGRNKDAANDIRGSLRSFAESEKRIWLFVAEAKAYSYEAARKNLHKYLDAVKTQPDQQMILSIRFALSEINEGQYIDEMKKSIRDKSKDIQNDMLCDAYFTIGLITFTSGQKIGAKKYFQKCLDYNAAGSPNQLIADAYVKGALQ